MVLVAPGPRRESVGLFEHLAEVGRVHEAPPSSYRCDGPQPTVRCGQLSPAFGQAACTDPVAEADTRPGQHGIEVTHGDVVCGGDPSRRQIGISQVLPEVLSDPG